MVALLLTRYLTNGADFHEWCRHHFSLGFTHIHVFDNTPGFSLESECTAYGDMVSYEKVSEPLQYPLYARYISSSTDEWVMPIDDDEFLQVSPRFSSIQEALEYYTEKLGRFDVFGIRWKYMFPRVFHSERTGSVLEYCTEESDYLATRFSGHGNHVIKCMVRPSSFVRYMDADESMSRNHIPVSTGTPGATLCDGTVTTSQVVGRRIDDEGIRLLHCPFKGLSEYLAKEEDHPTVSHAHRKQSHYRAFNYVLPRLD